MTQQTFNESHLIKIGDCLDGFGEFWEGYLLGLAFTGNDETGEEPEPLYSNPGGDIAEVVDIDKFSEALPNDDRLSLMSDCLSFFVDAMPMIGDRFSEAGSDFHLTRNGHGAGFWDGDWPDHGDALTAMSKPYGTAEVERFDGALSVRN